jgi:hypothetical protein
LPLMRSPRSLFHLGVLYGAATRTEFAKALYLFCPHLRIVNAASPESRRHLGTRRLTTCFLIHAFAPLQQEASQTEMR